MRSANEPCPYAECDGSGFVIDHEAFTTRECRCRPARLARVRATRLQARIPNKYADMSFDRAPVTSIDPTVVSEVRRFAGDIGANLDAGRGFWIMGDVGTGKTTLAMLASKAALEAGRTVAIYSLPHLLWVLRGGYADDAEHSYLQLRDAMTGVDLLHIDDVGAENSNEWVLEQVYSIVNTRYEDGKSMIFTTNLDPLQLGEQIGHRTASRLIEMCGDPLPLFGEDRRQPSDMAPPSPPPDRWEAPGGAARYGEPGAAARWDAA